MVVDEAGIWALLTLPGVVKTILTTYLRQINILKALGAPIPSICARFQGLMGDDGQKLSRRHELVR